MISVVVPLRDEAENVPMLVEELHTALEGTQFEIVCVDDGSEDATATELELLGARFPRLRRISHERSYGQSTAIVSGVHAARGELVVTIDGDGQNDPADISKLLDVWQASMPSPAMVVGWRRDRNDPRSKRLASWIANAAYRRLLKDDTRDVGCGLKLFRRDTFLELPQFDHMHRFLPALVASRGGRVVSAAVNHRPRHAGRSKYGVRDRLWVGLVDLLGVRWLQARSSVSKHASNRDAGSDDVTAPVPRTSSEISELIKTE